MYSLIAEFYAAERRGIDPQRLNEIRKRFIYDSKDEGISRSYMFGYEKDNPSYEFLKTKIFLEPSGSSETPQETVYTHNLEFAKRFFKEKLEALALDEKESIYRKLTQNLLFNIYTISTDIDVFVAFETMNNRGKLLSYLELLKNRLIYLSTNLKLKIMKKKNQEVVLTKHGNQCITILERIRISHWMMIYSCQTIL